ncbi:CRISPR system precrRNA processing endoribonuclease RAMP protein Cas6 [Thioalkalicoccus limnaeus]|uniref:CRISPR system precrRNA processing endoribonuclease RAMP protein Cas6 n=1 Tax=Thioalkalicoccus limnaeus TaxID=120681 RepID=A0ABV4BGH4_9GAMM
MDTAVTPLDFPPLARFRFLLTARDPVRLPDYPGSAWRGLLGHGLRRTACVTRQPTCGGCLLRRTCAYSTLFETPAMPHRPGYTALPHPFVLDIDPTAPRRYEPGETFSLTVHLIGAAIAQAPYLIHALTLAGRLGFGRARAGFELARVERETAPGSHDWLDVYEADEGAYHALETAPLAAPPAPARVEMRVVTPLRIKRAGHFVGARDLTAADLVQALYRRLRILSQLYGETDAAFDLHEAARQTTALRLDPSALTWHEWTRYSTRQDTLMQFGGLIGEVRLEGPSLPAIWPALWLGQWTHLGKGTAFGLGGYRIRVEGSERRSTADGMTTQACAKR